MSIIDDKAIESGRDEARAIALKILKSIPEDTPLTTTAMAVSRVLVSLAFEFPCKDADSLDEVMAAIVDLVRVAYEEALTETYSSKSLH